MEHSKETETQLFSAITYISLFGLTAISLILLNLQINIRLIEILAGILLIMVTGYSLTILFFSKKNELNISTRIILSPIAGILMIGLWSMVTNYSNYGQNTLYYELAVIPILILISIIRLAKYLKSRPLKSSKDDKKLKNDSNKVLFTAKAAALAKKKKLNKNKLSNHEKSLVSQDNELEEDNNKNNDSFEQTIPPIELPDEKSIENVQKSREASKKSRSMPQPKKSSIKLDEDEKTSSDKPVYAFKSENNSKTDKSEIEVFKVKKSYKDLLIIVGLAALSLILVLIPLPIPDLVIIPFIIFTIFFGSGYSILSGIFIRFPEKSGLIKIISSILLSSSLFVFWVAIINYLNLDISSSIIVGIFPVISIVMCIIGYLRRVRKQNKLKNELRPPEIARFDEDELNVLKVSHSMETQENVFGENKSIISKTPLRTMDKLEDSTLVVKSNDEYEEDINNSENKNSLEKDIEEEQSTLQENTPEPQQEDIQEENTPEPQYQPEEDHNQEQILVKEYEPKTVLPKLNLADEELLEPENKEEIQKHEKIDESSTSPNIEKESETLDEKEVTDQPISPSEARRIAMSRKKDMEKSNKKKLKDAEKSKSLPTTPSISLFNLILAIILSILGVVFTIPSISAMIPSINLGLFTLNAELVQALFLLPVLLYLPGYSIMCLFKAGKYANKTYSVGISIILSLSLGIILLSLNELFKGLNLSLIWYAGILSGISIVTILIVYWRGRSSIEELEELEEIPGKNIKSIFLPDEILNDTKTKYDKKIIKKSDDSEIKKPPKVAEKTSKKNYMEEDLEKSFSSSASLLDLPSTDKDPESPRNKKSSGFFSSYSDLFLILIITFLTIATIYTPYFDKVPLREFLGLLFVLFIPGYVLTNALFPRKNDLDTIEHIALSFGLSLAISPLIGLGLNYTPFGIRLTPIVIALTGFTIIMVMVIYLRRRNISPDEWFKPQISPFLRSLKKSFDTESRKDKILSIILVVSLILAIATTGYIIVKPKEGEKFTEFYILGPNGKASDYPTNLTVGQTGKLFVGVVNHEYAPVNYEMVVKLQDTIIQQENITLQDKQKMEKEINFTPSVSGSNQKLEFLLYKLPDREKPYRTLHLWVNVA